MIIIYYSMSLLSHSLVTAMAGFQSEVLALGFVVRFQFSAHESARGSNGKMSESRIVPQLPEIATRGKLVLIR